MPVTLQLPSVLSKGRQIQADGATVGAVVDAVARQYPDIATRLRDAAGEPYPYVTFYLNDEDIRLRGGFNAPVQDGDELIVVPAVAGG
jgi:molybdopterin synthase sulfur carrier subunit